jgi:nicotinate phosphoribosyltransferase
MPYTDVYFTRSKEIAQAEDINPRVRYNVFFRKAGIMCGTQAVKHMLLPMAYGAQARGEVFEMHALPDGAAFESTEPVMLLEAPYQTLVEEETAILGYLALAGPATRMKELVEAADGVPVVDMSARHYSRNNYLAYAACVGGAAGTSVADGWRTANYLLHDVLHPNADSPFKLFGSIPHCLNAVTGGSIEAAKLYAKTFPDLPLIVLTDYEGREMDVIRTAVEVFGEKLAGVRLDTHGGRIHQGGEDGADHYQFGKGVTIELYQRTRRLLDSLGAEHAQIVLSSGFNVEKIKAFRPFLDPERTSIGTGSWVGNQDYHATMDIVEVEVGGLWEAALKEGRTYTPSSRLERII